MYIGTTQSKLPTFTAMLNFASASSVISEQNIYLDMFPTSKFGFLKHKMNTRYRLLIIDGQVYKQDAHNPEKELELFALISANFLINSMKMPIYNKRV